MAHPALPLRQMIDPNNIRYEEFLQISADWLHLLLLSFKLQDFLLKGWTSMVNIFILMIKNFTYSKPRHF